MSSRRHADMVGVSKIKADEVVDMVGVSKEKADEVVERRVTKYLYKCIIVYFPEIKLFNSKVQLLWLEQSAIKTQKMTSCCSWELQPPFAEVGARA